MARPLTAAKVKTMLVATSVDAMTPLSLAAAAARDAADLLAALDAAYALRAALMALYAARKGDRP